MAQIFIIGSGLSAHLGISGWVGILQEIARRELAADDVSTISSVLNIPGSEYKAASLLASYLGGEAYLETKITRFLQAQQRSIERRRLLRFKPLLSGPQSICVITTNWDTLLTSLSGFELLCWPEERAEESRHLRNVGSYLSQKKKFVWHLHGALGKSSLVVTEAQRQARAESIKRHEDFLSGIFVQNEIYIVGNGFSDEHILELLKKCEARGTKIHTLLAKVSRAVTNLGDLAGAIDVETYPDLSGFYEAVIEFVSADDKTYDLVGLDALVSADDLLRKLEGCPWRFQMIGPVKDSLGDIRKLTTFAAAAAIDAFRGGNTDVAGFLATILSTSANDWVPSRNVFNELKRVVHRELASANPEAMLSLQPLAWVLGRKGEMAVAHEFQRVVFADKEMIAREFERLSEYYGDVITRYAGYKRHIKDRPAGGVLTAWDLPSLIVDLETARKPLVDKLSSIIKAALKELATVDLKLALELESEVAKIVSSRRIKELL